MKKVIACMLAALMLAAMLVGCGQQADVSGNGDSNEPALADGVYTAEFNTDKYVPCQRGLRG